ncbi:MAG: type VI secretion system baseplate subunit TssG [Planctomycetia bacterium]|nr:type VI secretion system baseplate subunit TssG [Planctomycetia bacterium]
MTLEQKLFEQPTSFDFFQTVFILEVLHRGQHSSRIEIEEQFRLKTFPSLVFPSSSVKFLRKKLHLVNKPHIYVNFLGLIGPQGALPLHYTLKVLAASKLVKEDGLSTSPLQEWLDLFNHRFLTLFYRAWEKYRFPVAYFHSNRLGIHQEKTAGKILSQTDDFTQALFSLIGLGVPGLRNRLRVESVDNTSSSTQLLAIVPDEALLHYAGNLAHRPRHASGLQALLSDYFNLRVKVQVLKGQWLQLDASSQSQMSEDGHCSLGEDVIAGERIWDFNSMFRISLGPLSYDRFVELLPDESHVKVRKTFYLLCQMTRFYVGPEFDFEVQLRLKGDEVPACELSNPGGSTLGARLGWNTWLPSTEMPEVVEDAVFQADDRTLLAASIVN